MTQGSIWTVAYRAYAPNTWFWMLLLFASNIPVSASNLYKEKVIRETGVDIFYLNTRVGLCHFVIGIVLLPLVYVPLPRPYVSMTALEFPFNVWNGAKCFFGVNSLEHDRCSDFFALFIAMVFSSCLFNYALLLVSS
jgi:hypothetical protein